MNNFDLHKRGTGRTTRMLEAAFRHTAYGPVAIISLYRQEQRYMKDILGDLMRKAGRDYREQIFFLTMQEAEENRYNYREKQFYRPTHLRNCRVFVDHAVTEKVYAHVLELWTEYDLGAAGPIREPIRESVDALEEEERRRRIPVHEWARKFRYETTPGVWDKETYFRECSLGAPYRVTPPDALDEPIPKDSLPKYFQSKEVYYSIQEGELSDTEILAFNYLKTKDLL